MGLPKLEHLPHYTYADYLLWEGNWELIDGIPYAMTPAPSVYHQEINVKLAAAALEALKNCSQCRVLLPIDWRIAEDTVVQPDLSVLCNNTETGAFITQAPAVVFEIPSPSTAQKDRTIKFNLYESQGVRYYVLVNPQNKSIEIFRLIGNRYQAVEETAQEAFRFDIRTEAECEFSVNFNEIW